MSRLNDITKKTCPTSCRCNSCIHGSAESAAAFGKTEEYRKFCSCCGDDGRKYIYSKWVLAKHHRWLRKKGLLASSLKKDLKAFRTRRSGRPF